MEYFLEPRDLVRLANARKEEYAAADPFPHVVIDDFLNPAQVDEILADFSAFRRVILDQLPSSDHD